MLLALVLGWWLGVAPFAHFTWSWRGLTSGIVATAPLLLGLAWCLRTSAAPLVRLVRLVEARIAPMFAGSSALALLVVALMAGVGEEALFRGVLQPALAGSLPAWVAVALTALLFGLVHWVTPTYALLAALVGGYLGALAVYTGNLLVPIVTHALYDAVALALLVRLKPVVTSSVL